MSLYWIYLAIFLVFCFFSVLTLLFVYNVAFLQFDKITRQIQEIAIILSILSCPVVKEEYLFLICVLEGNIAGVIGNSFYL